LFITSCLVHFSMCMIKSIWSIALPVCSQFPEKQ
jgi:hypothetical protein